MHRGRHAETTSGERHVEMQVQRRAWGERPVSLGSLMPWPFASLGSMVSELPGAPSPPIASCL